MPTSRYPVPEYTDDYRDSTASCCRIAAATIQALADEMNRVGNPDAQYFEAMARDLRRRGRAFQEAAQTDVAKRHANAV